MADSSLSQTKENTPKLWKGLTLCSVVPESPSLCLHPLSPPGQVTGPLHPRHCSRVPAVSCQAADRVLDSRTTCPAAMISPQLIPSLSISKRIILCCSYFLIRLPYPLDCEILKDEEHVLFIFVFSYSA